MRWPLGPALAALSLVATAAVIALVLSEFPGSRPASDVTEKAPAPGLGALRGTVRWAGPPPSRPMLPVTKDHATCGRETPNPELLVGADGGLANAVVTIDGVEAGAKFEAGAPIVFDQKGCVFTSHVLVVPVGATLDVRNSDDVLHNTHFHAVKSRAGNFAIPAGKRNAYRVMAPETIKVTCDVHLWMSAWVIARRDPYAAVTDEAGRYAIADVPPGRYRVSVWQETVGKGGARPIEVEFRAGETAERDFEVRPKE